MVYSTVSALLAQSSLGAASLAEFFQTAPVDARVAAQNLWLIIALPLLGAAVCGLLGRFLGRANTGLIASAMVFGSFLMALLVFWTIADRNTLLGNSYGGRSSPYALGFDYGTWFQAGDFRVNFGLAADHLSGTMLLVITGVGFLIHVYSTAYMSHDAGYWKFFAYLNLFVASMLTLVLADSLVLLFVGWEGVGMCSYLLIGFWYDDAAKAQAGRKAFIANRIGDFGFLLGAFLAAAWIGAWTAQLSPPQGYAQGLATRGPLTFQALETAARSFTPATLSAEIAAGPLQGYTFGAVLTAMLLCFMLGASGKSAQLPLYVWLPDAMAGPTPVSALIHAATMVTAGLYLFSRLSFLLVMSPFAMATIAVIGALTALLAALIAFAQDDIKKVLAYSTVSQLGIMFMGIGAGIFWAAFLHVVTHAFFKACLFLGAGSVMHGNGDETDIKKLGGLRHAMPWTTWTFLIATAAITGVLPLSGFFSKDAILHGLHTNVLTAYPNVLHTVWLLGLLAAACTAFYMTRLFVLAFWGPRSPQARVPHAHESSVAMTMPLVVLAVLSVAALVHGLPIMPNAAGEGPTQAVMENFLSPVFRSADELALTFGTFAPRAEAHGAPWGAWLQAWVIALVSAGLSFVLYTRVFTRGFPSWLAIPRKLAQNKFYVDELYNVLILLPLRTASALLFNVVDRLFIDRLGVGLTGQMPRWLGSGLRYFQTGDTQTYASVMVLALGVGLVLLVRALS